MFHTFLNYFVAVSPVCFEMIHTEIGPVSYPCFSTFAWPYWLTAQFLCSLPHQLQKQDAQIAMESPSDFLCCRKVQSCESVKRGDNLWDRKKQRCGTQLPSLLQTDMGTGLWLTQGTRWQPAALTYGCRQAHHCLVERGNWSQQTLPSDFTPHSFAQALWGPLQPWQGSPGCSAPAGCSLTQRAAW